MNPDLSTFLTMAVPRYLALPAQQAERLLLRAPDSFDTGEAAQRAELDHMVASACRFLDLAPMELLDLPLEGRSDHELAVLYEVAWAHRDSETGRELEPSLAALCDRVLLCIAQSKVGSRTLDYGYLYGDLVDNLTMSGGEEAVDTALEVAITALGFHVRAGEADLAVDALGRLAQALMEAGRADDAGRVFAALLCAEPLEQGFVSQTIDALGLTANEPLRGLAERRLAILKELLGDRAADPFPTSSEAAGPLLLSTKVVGELEGALSMSFFDGTYPEVDALARAAAPTIDTLAVKAVLGKPLSLGPLPKLPWRGKTLLEASDADEPIEPFDSYVSRVGREDGWMGRHWHFASWPGLGLLGAAQKRAALGRPEPELSRRLNACFSMDLEIRDLLADWFVALERGRANPERISSALTSFVKRRLYNREYALAHAEMVDTVRSTYDRRAEPRASRVPGARRVNPKARAGRKASRKARRKNR